MSLTPEPIEPAREPDSIGELFRRLLEDVVHLVRTELRLARAELAGAAGPAMGGLALIIGGVVFASAALLCLVGALVAWLATFLGVTGAALASAAILGVLAAILVGIGLGAIRKTELAPRRAVANVKRDVQALKGE